MTTDKKDALAIGTVVVIIFIYVPTLVYLYNIKELQYKYAPQVVYTNNLVEKPNK